MLNRYPVLCTVFWSNAQKGHVKLSRRHYRFGISLRCLRWLHVCWLWGWIPRWHSGLKFASGVKVIKGHGAWEISFGSDGIKSCDLCSVGLNPDRAKQVWTLHLDGVSQRHVGVCIFSSEQAGRAYVFAFHDSLSVCCTNNESRTSLNISHCCRFIRRFNGALF